MEVNQLPLDKTEIVKSANWNPRPEAVRVTKLKLVALILPIFRLFKQPVVCYIGVLGGNLKDVGFEKRSINLNKKTEPLIRIQNSVDLKKNTLNHLRTMGFWLNSATLAPHCFKLKNSILKLK